MTRGNLVEDISEILECCYLSDLHSLENKLLMIPVLRSIRPEQYPLKEWNDAVHYILEQPKQFLESEEAYDYLLEQLEKC